MLHILKVMVRCISHLPSDALLHRLYDWFLNCRCCTDRYIFFVTLLSIHESNFTVAFKMFDIDHSG